MTTKQIATKVLNIAIENAGYRIQNRWLANRLNISAAQLSAALDHLGNQIVRVRGVAGYICAA